MLFRMFNMDKCWMDSGIIFTLDTRDLIRQVKLKVLLHSMVNRLELQNIQLLHTIQLLIMPISQLVHLVQN